MHDSFPLGHTVTGRVVGAAWFRWWWRRVVPFESACLIHARDRHLHHHNIRLAPVALEHLPVRFNSHHQTGLVLTCDTTDSRAGQLMRDDVFGVLVYRQVQCHHVGQCINRSDNTTLASFTLPITSAF